MPQFRLVAGLTLCLLGPPLGAQARFEAFSLQAAQAMLSQGDDSERAALLNLGGITRLAGLVRDTSAGDIVLIGQTVAGDPPITIDSLAVALRARALLHEWPQVSIDETVDTAATQTDVVDFRGGLQDSEFGAALLSADVCLKKITLGTSNLNIWGIRSYFDRLLDATKAGAMPAIGAVKFWYYPQDPAVTVSDRVYVINELHIGVQARFAHAGKAPAESNAVAEAFARSLTSGFDAVADLYPEVARLRQLYGLTAIAEGIESMPPAPVEFLLHRYKLNRVGTLRTYPVVDRHADVPGAAGRSIEVRISGGVAMSGFALRLMDGDASALYEAVTSSRPRATALSWTVPLDGWEIPGYRPEPPPDAREARSGATDGQPGCVFRISSEPVGGMPSPRISTGAEPTAQNFERALQSLQDTDSAQPRFARDNNFRPTGGVGGVLLDACAKVQRSSDGAAVGAGLGGFSLILDGRNSRLDPMARRRFITALWAVYFGRADPGISIDPIAPGSERQLVRYIGDVMNTDLGRVMREADYLMKHWAVGTDRPQLPGFRNPDDFAAQNGVVYVGAMSRFWFVPQDMVFRATGNALLFDSGRMTVRTEFMTENRRGLKADRANEQFAAWFTHNFHRQIAPAYPVFQDLFEYAKVVSLAKYLKAQGVPLYWYLLAHMDDVLTEDSPGTVATLSRNSAHFQDVSIEGGVQLCSENSYVLDAQARDAIAAARARAGSPPDTGGPSVVSVPASPSHPFSFQMGRSNYTLAPQQSSAGGEGSWGDRYQTDVMIREEGFELRPSTLSRIAPELKRRLVWELVRPYAEAMTDTQFASRSDSLLSDARGRAESQTAEILQKLELLFNHHYGSEAAFAHDAEFALGQSAFEQNRDILIEYAHYTTDLDFVRCFNPNASDSPGQFGTGWRLAIPYQLRPEGDQLFAFRNARVPARMRLTNLLNGRSETLRFQESGKIKDGDRVAGYFPENPVASRIVGVPLMTDGSFGMVDKLGTEYAFDGIGRMTHMSISEDHSVGVEYADGATDACDSQLFRLSPGRSGRTVKRQNVDFPEEIVLQHPSGTEERFRFDPNAKVLGYTPERGGSSCFQMVAVMSDGSFRLVDRQNNEIAFAADGSFDRYYPDDSQGLVRSMSMGRRRLTFRYAFAPDGRPLISRAWISTDESGAKPDYVLAYDYDGSSTLTGWRLEAPDGTRLAGIGVAPHSPGPPAARSTLIASASKPPYFASR